MTKKERKKQIFAHPWATKTPQTDKMCHYDEKGRNRGERYRIGGSRAWEKPEKDWKQERKRVTCPVCKR